MLRQSLLFGAMFVSLAIFGVVSSPEEKNLLEALFKRQDYNPLIRPVKNLSETITVGFEMSLIQLITLDEKRQIMKTNIWLRVRWHDYQLAWKPEKFGGISALRIMPDRLWTPDIVLFNNADGKFEVSFKSNVVLYNSGDIMWIPCAIYKSSCTLDVNHFPFDEQRCDMIFGSWTYDGTEVDLNTYIENFEKVDLTDYEKSGTWDVIGVPGRISNVYDEKEGQNISRATYTIVMRRKTLYYATNLILPCSLISVLTMVVFYLPATAGEKVTMSVSILLALVVFLQVLVTNLLPPTSLSLPLFAKYLLFAIVIDICSILNTIISLNWNWKTPRTHSMPEWLRTLFFKYLARALMMQRPGDISPPAAAAADADDQLQLHDFTVTSSMPVSQAAQNSKSLLSNAHHPECKYHSMSLRQRQKLLESGDSSRDVLSKDLSKAVEAVRFIAAHLKNENDYDEIIDDWQFVSLLLDRLLFYIYLTVTVVGTLGILLNTYNIFVSFDQLAFKNATRDERFCRENFPLEDVYEDCLKVGPDFRPPPTLPPVNLDE